MNPSIIAVQCQQIIKEFGDGHQTLRVLHNIDVTFGAGKLTLIVGPSGCGKTTLISIIAGILSTTHGSVNIFNNEVTAMKGATLVKFRLKNIGFIFQQYNLIPQLTAAENAAVPLVAAQVPKRVAIRTATEILERMGMGARATHLPAELSGGEQQRVAIARALVHNPRLVVCDEPTSSLDAASGHSVMSLIRDIAVAPDRACIVVTHDHRVFSFADHIVEMEDGRILREYNSNEISLLAKT